MQKLYPSQQPNEKIMLVVRETLFLLFVRIAFVFILILIPAIIGALVSAFDLIAISEEATSLISVGVQLYYLGTLIALFIILTLYYLNINVVSDQRIVDIDQRSLLYREVSELNIETIEDVTTETKGLFGNIVNYGTVFIQTAGARERFEFNNVPQPDAIASLILQLYEQHDKKKPRV